MSYAPLTLIRLGSYMNSQGVPVLGIVGNTAHTGGYHLGKDRLRATDYSIRTTRDKAGLSNAAAAIDLGRFPRFIELCTWLIAQCQENEPNTRDIREVILEAPDGRHIRRWDDVRQTLLGTGKLADTHHLHISYYRDSEYRDKRLLFEAFFLPDTSEDEMIYSIKGVDGPFPATVLTGTPYYSSADDKTPTGTIDQPDRPFTVICESKDGQRRCIYGRTSPAADRAVLGWVASDRIVR